VTQRDALADERRAIRSAHDAFALASRAAERAHAAATRQAARRLRAALAGSEAAKPIEATYRKRHRELETRCRAEEQRLLEAFRANRVGARASYFPVKK
jgi:hypothetical protein